MNGHNIVVDTSLLVNFFNGSPVAKEIIEDQDLWISGITEIEILSSPKLSPSEKKLIREFIQQTTVIDLLAPIKEIAIQLRISKTLKLPDSIIAATALHLDFPLISYDKEFSKVKDLNFMFLKN
jgi:predicted nucleic acid-binding protein